MIIDNKIFNNTLNYFFLKNKMYLNKLYKNYYF